MTLRRVQLSPAVITLHPDMSLRQALDFMLDRGINHLPVLGDSGYLGLLEINDILRELIPPSARIQGGLQDLRFVGEGARLLTQRLQDLDSRTVGDAVRRDLPSLQPDCPLLEAALLLSRQSAPLPVLDPAGRLLGMLSRRALLRHLVSLQGEGA